MEERQLRFSHKKRHIEAPQCPCGEPNDKSNPQFAPFEGTNGEYGYCHRCDRRFMPQQDESAEKAVKYVPPPKEPQKFIEKEPVFSAVFMDTVIDPPVSALSELSGQFYVTFYFRNIQGKLTSAKKMLYNFADKKMKRVKEVHPLYLYQRDSGYYACLFNERDLFLFPNAKVILVESEKTAAILRYKMKAHLSEFIYLGTGGANGLSEEKMSVLKGRDVYVCYDCDEGELQPDGSIKNPKGREAAKTAVTKLSAICNAFNYDINPELKDGTDLADLPDMSFDYIQAIPAKSENRIPSALVQQLRELHQEGERITDEVITKLSEEHLIAPNHIRDIFFVIRKEYEHEWNIKKAPLLKKIEFFLSQRYEFRRNSINKRVFYKTIGTKMFKECNDSDLWREIQHNIQFFGNSKTKVPITDIRSLLESDYVKDYNPFEEYFLSLPQWDNIDHINKLASYVQCEDQRFWVEQFKKALVRSIACTLDGVPNRIVMVLIQEDQNRGKSSYIRFLCPPALIRYYKEDKMKKDNKDSEIALAENFIWNLEELDQLSKKDVSEIKDIISRKYIKQRRSYGRYEEDAIRIVNFWGSTNKIEFLTDTQNTRWLCFKVNHINPNYDNYITGTREISIDKVWAQAYYLYKTNFDYNLTSEEQQQRDLMNKSFENVTNEKELIIKYLKQATTEEEADFMMSVDILKYLIEKTGNQVRLAGENIGRGMKQLGFKQTIKKINGKVCRGYLVIKRDAVEEDPITPEPSLLLFTDEVDTDELPF